MLLVLSGIAFKIGAFLFQIWVPDVYQGAPIPTVPPFGDWLESGWIRHADATGRRLRSAWRLDVSASLGLGSFDNSVRKSGCFNPEESQATHGVIRRIPCGISHAWGYRKPDGRVGRYGCDVLFVRLPLASIAVFAVMAHIDGASDSELSLDDLGDLAKRNGFSWSALGSGHRILAGIPPLAGFIGKLLIFVATFQAEQYGPLGVAVVGVWFRSITTLALSRLPFSRLGGLAKMKKKPRSLYLAVVSVSSENWRSCSGCRNDRHRFYQAPLSSMLAGG